MNNQLNQNLQNIAMAKKSGRNPQQIMQTMLRSNPQLQQTMTQMQNMPQGKTPREFIMQLAKQNGADEMALAMLAQLFDN